jgi:hypothetical protein
MESNFRAPDGSPLDADPKRVWQIGVTGLGIALAAAAFGLAMDWTSSEPHDWANRVRNSLTPLGILIAGCAVSMRPRQPSAWVIGAAACLAGRFGFAPEWDSARLVATVLAVVGALGILMLYLPPIWRVALASVLILFHFSGILSAVLSPPTTPWLVSQGWTRVFRNYLMFTYMNNAYQFYSPNPGAASEVWFCIEYVPKGEAAAAASGQKPRESVKKWVKIPRRAADFKDPLGQAYYRRLAITEQLIQPGDNYVTAREYDDIQRRRNAQEAFPIIPTLYQKPQFLPPSDLVRRFLLPAYVQHIAVEFANPDMDVRAIKVYRVEHQLLSAEDLVKGLKYVRGDPTTHRPSYEGYSPYDPATYLPYYQGEYDANGNLLDPRDPLLFWLIPIVRKPGETITGRMNSMAEDVYAKYFDDYVIKHAGSDHRKELLP